MQVPEHEANKASQNQISYWRMNRIVLHAVLNRNVTHNPVQPEIKKKVSFKKKFQNYSP